MFEISFLGTSAAVPSAERGLPALVVDHGPRRFLVDCGEGTQRQLLRGGLGLRRLGEVLLTHGHADHVLGLPGLAATLAQWERGPRLEIRAGRHALGVARTLLEDALRPFGDPGVTFGWHELRPGVAWEDAALRIAAFPLAHPAPDSFGFRFEEKTPARRLDPERLDALGVPDGPERGTLASGGAAVLPDGRTVAFEDVATPPLPPLTVAVVGDTGPFPGLADAVRGADLLVIEATFLEADAARAAAGGHMTARASAEVAREAGVRALRLTHVSHRYAGPEIEAEARAVFPGAVVAADFDRVRVARGGIGPAAPHAPGVAGSCGDGRTG